MKAAKTVSVGRLGILASAVIFGVASAQAEQRTYTLDPARSILTASGTLAGGTASPQRVGANVTTYTGSILADVTSGTIRFIPGSEIDAVTNIAGSFQPDDGGDPGSAPGDYGLQSSGGFGVTSFVAYRSLFFDLNSAALPLTNGTFQSNQFSVRFDDGWADYFAGSASFGTRDFFGRNEFNNATAPSTITVVGNVEEISIPINISTSFGAQFSNDSTLFLTGTLVGTRPVPEPAGLTALLVGSMLLVRRRR